MAKTLNHIAIICDGNGRWAFRRGKHRSEGHDAGKEKIQSVMEWCLDMKIPYVSFYCLSVDNLKRDKQEVDHLFVIGRQLFGKENIQRLKKKGVRVVFSGDRSLLQTDDDRKGVADAEAETAECSALVATMHICYSGRDEIVRAAQACVDAGEPITQEGITAHLFTAHAGVPEPDVIIRTGGDSRLSDFLPWQSTYSEIYTTQTLWPDFTKEEFAWVCKWYEGIENPRGGDRESTKRKSTKAAEQRSQATVKQTPPFATKKGVTEDGTGSEEKEE